jgi:hypothetical protein
MVAERSAESDRRRLVPRLALVGAVTAVMLAALGATGTASYAAVAMSSFGSTIGDVVQLHPKTTPKPSVGSRASTSKTSHSTAKAFARSQSRGSTSDTSGSTLKTSTPATSGSTSQTSGSQEQKAGGDPANASPFQDQYQQKWPICHNGITLYLPLPGYNAHLLHGDQPGVCS